MPLGFEFELMVLEDALKTCLSNSSRGRKLSDCGRLFKSALDLLSPSELIFGWLVRVVVGRFRNPPLNIERLLSEIGAGVADELEIGAGNPIVGGNISLKN